MIFSGCVNCAIIGKRKTLWLKLLMLQLVMDMNTLVIQAGMVSYTLVHAHRLLIA